MRVANLSPRELWLTAAEWGSYMTGGDPGACMYGFTESGTVQSEEHRAACLDWIDNHCRHAANVNIAAGDKGARTQHAELDALRKAIERAPVTEWKRSR